MSQWWSWVLGVWGLLGFVLAGQRVWWSWWVNLACQGAWFAYAVVTEQWGFLVATVGYTVVFTRNAVKWTRERATVMGSGGDEPGSWGNDEGRPA